MKAPGEWEPGTCKGSRARRHRTTGAVEVVLWKAGERAQASDFWIALYPTHWAAFIPDR